MQSISRLSDPVHQASSIQIDPAPWPKYAERNAVAPVEVKVWAIQNLNCMSHDSISVKIEVYSNGRHTGY